MSMMATVDRAGSAGCGRRGLGYLFKRDIVRICGKLARAVLLIGMCFMIIEPILNKISISFMSEDDLYNPLIISIPEHFTSANYILASEFMEYFKTLGNGFIISLTIAILQIMGCTLVVYGLARG